MPPLRCSWAKASGLAAAAIALAATSLVVSAPSTGAADGFTFERLAGGDRFATAAAIALDAFPGGSATVLMARSDDYPDALAGNFLAGVGESAILLSATGDVPAATMTGLGDLAATEVVLLGGIIALGPAVQAELLAAGYEVSRVAGGNRYGTAQAIAELGGSAAVGTDPSGRRTALLSTGRSFTDALAAGPIAFNRGFPQLLTVPETLSPEAADAIETLDVDHVLITGGVAAVSSAVETSLLDLGLTVERVAGGDRYLTATALATKALALGHQASTVDVATGDDFTDALVGGTHAGIAQATLVLDDPTGVSTAACDFLEANSATLTGPGFVLGGVAAVSNAAEASLEACAIGPGAPEPEPDVGIDPPPSGLVDLLEDLLGLLAG